MIHDYDLIYNIYPGNVDRAYSYTAGNSVFNIKIEVTA